ncbi:MAG: response regulator transcription factor [Actinomycetota bacterium]
MDPSLSQVDLQALPTRVLLVEDDETVSDVVRRYLEREGFEVDLIGDGMLALEKIAQAVPDLVILDIMLPGLDGLEVCRRVRQMTAVPVVMLTALGEESDRIIGLELGADDYITKPFSPKELVSRVKAVLRRAHDDLSATGRYRGFLAAGELRVDVASREVMKGDLQISLTSLEFELLTFFMMRPHRAFRREDLLEQVWGFSYGDTSTVTVHIRRLRDKVENDPSVPQHIKTVWGVGYRFDP